MIRFEGATPILKVKNFTASMEYYVNKLGFEKKWDWGEPPTFGGRKGSLEFGFPFSWTTRTHSTKSTRIPAHSFGRHPRICRGERAR